MNEDLYVVNSDGVIVDTIESNIGYAKLSSGDRVLRKGTIQYLSDTKDIKYSFAKVNTLAWKEIAPKYPILNILIHYIGYMDGILTYRNGKNVQMKDIPKLCNVSESTTKRQLSMLVKEDIIHKIKDNKTTYLKFNPYIAMVGKKINIELYNEFKMSQWQNKIEVFEK